MGDAEARAQRADGGRFVGAFFAQAVIDRRRREPRRLPARAAPTRPPWRAARSNPGRPKRRAAPRRTRRAAREARRSSARRAQARGSTMILLHFAFSRLLDRRRGGRIALADFGERRAGLIVAAEHGERLAEPQHALGRARRLAVVGGELEILLRRLARPRTLEVGLAEIEDRVGRQAMRAVGGEEGFELLLGLGVLAGAIGVDRGVELLLRRVGEVDSGAGDGRRAGNVGWRDVGDDRPGRRRRAVRRASPRRACRRCRAARRRSTARSAASSRAGAARRGRWGRRWGRRRRRGAASRRGRVRSPGAAPGAAATTGGAEPTGGAEATGAAPEGGGAAPPRRYSTSCWKRLSWSCSRRCWFSSSSMRPLACLSSFSSRLSRTTISAGSLGSPASGPTPGITAGGAVCAGWAGEARWNGLRSKAQAPLAPATPTVKTTTLAQLRRERGVTTSNLYRGQPAAAG